MNENNMRVQGNGIGLESETETTAALPIQSKPEPELLIDVTQLPTEEPIVPIDSIDDEDPEYRSAIAKTASRPDTWDDIIGNVRAKEMLREAATAAKKQGRSMDHVLLFGPPGVGKTTLAKMVAKEMASGCVETTASSLATHADVIRTMHVMNLAKDRTNGFSVLFIDEIHGLGKRGLKQEAIYPLLEDFVFYHNLLGKRLQITSDGTEATMDSTTFKAWPFTAIGATTEPGLLSQPLLRRFLIQIELEPYSDDDISEIIVRASKRRETAITETAAVTLSSYCRRNPGRAFSLMAHARNRTATLNTETITDDVVKEVIERLQLYPQGLTETDVRALQVLGARMPRGVGQAELSKALGISLGHFVNNMEPYLRQLGFIETLNRRVLTKKGLRYLEQVGKADLQRPELRAILSKIKN